MRGDVYVHPFSAPPQGSADEVVQLLGGKGAGLAAMTADGLPVPPGFTLTTAACRRFMADGWQPAFDEAIRSGLDGLESETAKQLGAGTSPLLVSVRSGAAVSMPGMMDTVLNVGMSPDAERALATLTGDQQFATDTRRRSLLGFAEIVLGAPAAVLAEAGERSNNAAVGAVLADRGFPVPDEPAEQIRQAVQAVFESWSAPRAIEYRRIEGIDDSIGTAVTVQAMVFGNLGERSGTGVAFTRDPSTGERRVTGDFLPCAQGEDVVAGAHVTLDLGEMEHRWPERWAELVSMAARLEQRYQDMVDIEFTIEQDRLWMLQARVGKRSPIATLRIAIDMAEDPAFELDRAGAVERCRAQLDDPPHIRPDGPDGPDPESELPVIATGIGASPGVVSGVLCLDVDEAVRLEADGIDVILARRETSPADVHGMAAARGLFTTLGGRVSHAAVVARSWGTPAVVGAGEAEINSDGIIGPGGRVGAGELVTVDGDRGELLAGASDHEGVPAPEVLTLRRWAAELDAERQVETGAGGAPSAATATAAGGAGEDNATAQFAVMHGLRIKGMAKLDGVVAISCCPPEAAEGVLQAMEAAGHAKHLEGPGFWQITPEGREAHGELLAERVAALQLDGLPYEEFLALNLGFKQLCTEWQLIGDQPNDHSDPAYDAAVIERLVAHDETAQTNLAGLAEAIDWLDGYGPRLASALGRLQGGETSAFTGVMCDSYHDVWMELHEDLILTQGIDRAAEGST